MDVTPFVEHDEPDFDHWRNHTEAELNTPKPTKRVKQPVQFEGNERGVDSLMKAPQLVKLTLEVTNEEAQLIAAALLEYKKNLRQTLSNVKPPHNLEDETFCYGVLAQIARMQFDLLDNHGDAERRFMHRYIDLDEGYVDEDKDRWVPDEPTDVGL